MAISSGQVTPSTSTSAPLCTIPPGVGTVVISNTSGATVIVAAAATATQTNGITIPTGAPPVTFATYPGSRGAALSIIGATGGTVTSVVSWLISSGQ